MKTFPLIDLHQDLLPHLRSLDLFPEGKQTDFEMLKAADAKIVAATAFPLPPDGNVFHPVTNDLIEEDFRGYIRQTQMDPAWSIIRSAADVARVLREPNQHGLLLHIEGLNVIGDADWARLQSWVDLGWRSAALVWNVSNPLGGGTHDAETGLSDLGRKMIAWLQERRMVVDFAHMNRPTFWDALETVDGPIVISHGGVNARCPSARNYDDDQLFAVAKRHGVLGMFFANTFVAGRGKTGTVADVANHIDDLVKTMGVEHVALGTDFGGILSGLVQGLESLERLPNLWLALARRGYTDDDLERIAWKNAARVLTEIL